MTDTYVLGQVGIEFAGQLTNDDDPDNVTPVDLANNSGLYVRFFRPDGTSFEKSAQARDPGSLDNTYITFENDGESILDQKGGWSYTVGARFADGSTVESPNRDLFWVV